MKDLKISINRVWYKIFIALIVILLLILSVLIIFSKKNYFVLCLSNLNSNTKYDICYTLDSPSVVRYVDAYLLCGSRDSLSYQIIKNLNDNNSQKSKRTDLNHDTNLMWREYDYEVLSFQNQIVVRSFSHDSEKSKRVAQAIKNFIVDYQKFSNKEALELSIAPSKYPYLPKLRQLVWIISSFVIACIAIYLALFFWALRNKKRYTLPQIYNPKYEIIAKIPQPTPFAFKNCLRDIEISSYATISKFLSSLDVPFLINILSFDVAPLNHFLSEHLSWGIKGKVKVLNLYETLNDNGLIAQSLDIEKLFTTTSQNQSAIIVYPLINKGFTPSEIISSFTGKFSTIINLFLIDSTREHSLWEESILNSIGDKKIVLFNSQIEEYQITPLRSSLYKKRAYPTPDRSISYLFLIKGISNIKQTLQSIRNIEYDRSFVSSLITIKKDEYKNLIYSDIEYDAVLVEDNEKGIKELADSRNIEVVVMLQSGTTFAKDFLNALSERILSGMQVVISNGNSSNKLSRKLCNYWCKYLPNILGGNPNKIYSDDVIAVKSEVFENIADVKKYKSKFIDYLNF